MSSPISVRAGAVRHEEESPGAGLAGLRGGQVSGSASSRRQRRDSIRRAIRRSAFFARPRAKV